MIEYICHLKSLGGNTDSAIHIPHLGPARRSSRGLSGWAAHLRSSFPPITQTNVCGNSANKFLSPLMLKKKRCSST